MRLCLHLLGIRNLIVFLCMTLQSARIQTVVCIPLLGGVVEFGTTERVRDNFFFLLVKLKGHLIYACLIMY